MSAAAAGYSGTPLPKKLGFRPGMQAMFVGLPDELGWLAQAEDFAGRVVISDFAELATPFPLRGGRADLIHAFYTDAARLKAELPILREAIHPSGMIWISWPKKSARVATDITEDVVRAAALEIRLVDVKVCAVTEVWSGLKLVIPVAQRVPT